MSSAAQGAEAAGWIGPGQRISMITQLRGGLSRLRAVAGPLALLALATCALSLGAQLAASVLGVSLTGAQLSPAYGAYVIVTTLASSVLSAMATRTLVRGRDGWFRVDGPLVIGAGVVSAATLAFLGLNAGYMHALQTSPDPSSGLWAAMLALAGYFFGAYAALRLALWPIGLMMDNPRVTPARSWRLMKKATRGLVLGYIVLSLPLLVVSMLGSRFLAADFASGTLSPLRIATSVLGVAFAYCGSALIATIYDLRVTRAGNVAEVFD